eukprot:Hpha_TRINITY_DN15880_c1_g3::TRINITY_DN15880_c1_g3_i1::g.187997::m.187997
MARVLPVDFSVLSLPDSAADPEAPSKSQLITPEWLRKGTDEMGWEGWKKGFLSGLMAPLCFRMQRPCILRSLNIPEGPVCAVAAWYTGAAHGTGIVGILGIGLLSVCVFLCPSFVLACTALALYLGGLVLICYSVVWAEIFRWQWCIHAPPPADALAKVEACRRLNPAPRSCTERSSTLCKSFFVRYGVVEENKDSIKQELDRAGYPGIPLKVRDSYHGAADIANTVLHTTHCTFFFFAFWVAMTPMALHDVRGRTMQREGDGSFALSTFNTYVWFLTMIFPLVLLWPAGHLSLMVGRRVTKLRLDMHSRQTGLMKQGLQWVLTWHTPVWEKEPPFTLWLVRTLRARKAALTLLLALAALGKKDPRRQLPRDLLGKVAEFVAAAHTTAEN